MAKQVKKSKTIKTSTGFVCEIDVEKIANDMELLEALIDLENDNLMSVPVIIKKIFDAETKKRLYDHVREDGRVPIDSLGKELGEIFTGGVEGEETDLKK